MNYKKYQEKAKKEWLNENCKISQLMSTNILSLKPNLGLFIKVDRIDIIESIFPEEYEKIMDAYRNVIEKLNNHYKENFKNLYNTEKENLKNIK